MLYCNAVRTHIAGVMYMRSLFVLLIALSFVAFLGCDEINPPYEKGAVIGPTDTSGYGQKVLIEELTGHTCRNCPDGHKVSAQLKGLYGENVITMAVHAGGFAEVTGQYPEDFNTPAGTQLKNLFNVSSYPAGIINRQKIDGNFVRSSTAWSADVSTALNQTAPFKIVLTKTFDAASGGLSLTATIQTKSVVTTKTPVNLAIYVVEDSIVAPQLDKTLGRIPDYLHRDVLRDSPNGAFGVPISSSMNFASGTKIVKNLNYSFAGKTWDLSHCKIIACVCLGDPEYTILQVAEIKVKD